MPDTKPVFEAHPANRIIRSTSFGRALFDSSSSPISPKMHELLARYEALHATEYHLKPSKPVHEIWIP